MNIIIMVVNPVLCYRTHAKFIFASLLNPKVGKLVIWE